MNFTDTGFILAFLPVFLTAYALIPDRFKAAVLFAGSVFFYYSAAGIGSVLLFLILIALNYFLARLMDILKERKRTAVFIFILMLDVGFLISLKYFAGLFRVGTAYISLFGKEQSSFMMPGISFFTFQLCAYIADVYRNTVSAEKDVLTYANAIAAFPKIISGPIVRYSGIKEDLVSLHTSRKDLEDGFELFAIGLIYKVLIADTLSGVRENILMAGYESISTPLAWIGALSYSLRLYFDFQGYSLMAIGTGKMLGLHIPKNFDHPYMSSSISEFWRRWHITLGAWFKDYVYIPLGGNRKGSARTFFNLFAVWLLTGLWHGAGAGFIIWGLVNFTFIALEKLFLMKYLEKHKALSHVYVCLVSMLFWVVFAIPDIRDTGIYFMRMFPLFGSTGGNVYELDFTATLRSYGPVLAAGIFACFPVIEKTVDKFKGKFWLTAVEFVLFWFSIFMIVRRGTGTFMYFAF